MWIDYLILPTYYLIWSLVTFVVYGIDKSAAKRNVWRVSESTLHLLSILGGWPGALLGQKVFHHKTKKFRFRVVFWLTLILNLALLVVAYLYIFR
ncbi:DNA-binding protein [Marinomonas ushuaiensis DSM 15871]|uniref:DNA-binding protein n=1 Tax=Marinomonas ushuaiensis DSM 15871 TaxID=1122207 RepID=X7E2I4_9GAMM|nr:DUF1294 domain-containing protein [Marinomonas ushuaiensis]ETX10279.1 DNA-binding protein [Marinomonas ushuaiensis DSM 15871]